MLVACGSSSDSTAPSTSSTTETTDTTTTTAPAVTIKVRVVVEHAGFGCTGDSPISGTGSRLVVKDEKGTALDTGTFALSPGAKSCDWTATVAVPGDSSLIVLAGNQGELATLERADYRDGTVTLTSVAGSIRVT